MLYSLVPEMPDQQDGAEDRFTIDRETGQIKVGKKLDFELAQDETNTEADNEIENAVENNEYVVRVQATDPTGSSDTINVIITVKDVNEAPMFATGAPVALTVSEEETQADGYQLLNPPVDDADPVALEPGAYVATDEDKQTKEVNNDIVELTLVEGQTLDIVTYSVGGDDEDAFSINAATGVLEIDEDHTPNFEKQSSYSITVTASDGKLSSSKEVTVTVRDAIDDGEIELSQRRPQQGRTITAMLTDEDGDRSGTAWQWFRGSAIDGTLPTDPNTPRQLLLH